MASIVDRVLEQCKDSKYVNYLSYQEEARLRKKMKYDYTDAKILEVRKLNNKYLHASFMLKRQEKNDYQVMELIHSTAAENVSSIERNNLDWRRVERSRYGVGVSFSGSFNYANRHSSISGGSRRAFLICDVLVSRKKAVSRAYGTEAPSDDEVDTFQSFGDNVYVKFDDFTFLPKYAIFYNR